MAIKNPVLLALTALWRLNPLLSLCLVSWRGSSTVQAQTADAVLAWSGSNVLDVPVAAQSGVTAFAGGYWHSVVLKADGTVVAWGLNQHGQVTGTPTITNYLPVITSNPVTLDGQVLSGVTAVAAGNAHTVALRNNGSVIAWGLNESGQTNVPAAAQGEVRAIAAGEYHTVALKLDGSVVAWGNNFAGQTTVPVAAQNGVIAIAAGSGHTVVLRNNGSVVAWGWNGSGQTNVPIAAQSEVTAIAAGNIHTVALKSDGSVVAWGGNFSGQTAVPAEAQSGVTAIAAGYEHTLVLKTDGSVVIWGRKDEGQTTVPAEAQSGVKAIAAGPYYNLALIIPTTPVIKTPPISQTVNQWQSASFTVSATGYALNYQWRKDGVDLAGATNANYVLPFAQTKQAGGYTVVVKNLVGSATSAPPALLAVSPASPGAVVAWGWNGFGQATVPLAAQSGVTAIAAGEQHTVALKNNGTVLAWGFNGFGEVTGTPTTGDLDSAIANPVTLRGQLVDRATSIAAGRFHTVALKDDGTVSAWGDNSQGQVSGTPTVDDPKSAIANPVTLNGQVLRGATAIAAGASHTVALKEDGSLVAWGGNLHGEVTGMPTTDDPYSAIANPVTLEGQVLRGVKAIAAGVSHTVALKEDGSVVAWGMNVLGQVTGPPMTGDSEFAIANPVTLGGQVLSGVTAIAAGAYHTVTLKNDHSVAAWGLNHFGQVTGTPTFDELRSAIANPITLGGQALSSVKAIAAGVSHTLTLKDDGSVVAWGMNTSGPVTGTPPPVDPDFAIANPVTLGGQALSGVTTIVASGIMSGIGTGVGHSVAILGFVPLLPSLGVRPNGHELILTWPADAAGFSLQSTSSLTPPVTWIDSSDSPAVIGTQLTVTNTISPLHQFYRLTKPSTKPIELL